MHKFPGKIDNLRGRTISKCSKFLDYASKGDTGIKSQRPQIKNI